VLSAADVDRTAALSVRAAAKTLRTSPATIIRSRRTLLKTGVDGADSHPRISSETPADAPLTVGF
jgi:hypothetical protein